MSCLNSSRVAISFQGTSKYDVKLSLADLDESDEGIYLVETEVDGFVEGRRNYIRRKFLVSFKHMLPTIHHPSVTRFENGSYDVRWDVSEMSRAENIIYYVNVLNMNLTEVVNSAHYQLSASRCPLDPCAACILSIAAEDSVGRGTPVEVELRPKLAEGNLNPNSFVLGV